MSDWYSEAREVDGRTDEEIMAEIKYRADTGTSLREAIKTDLTALAHLTPEDWAERRGADPIARTINAARDIVDARFDAARPATDPAGLDETLDSQFADLVDALRENRIFSRGDLAARLSVADGPGPT